MPAFCDRPVVIRTQADLNNHIKPIHTRGSRLAFVPTMGCLHEGHLALVERAQAIADHVIVSIFVNPTQFGPDEDYATYPRDEDTDRQKLAALGVDYLYAPTAQDMYPEGFASQVETGRLAQILCGEHRPGHFAGVATIIVKFLNRIRPQIAVFGEKDYQQLQIIRRITTDLDLNVAIEAVPVIRNREGLALSSRNLYLSNEDRKIAPELYRHLRQLEKTITQNPSRTAPLLASALLTTKTRLKQAGFTRIDYVTIIDPVTLAPVETITAPARLLAAVWLGNIRLIDNIAIHDCLSSPSKQGNPPKAGRSGTTETIRKTAKTTTRNAQ